ncbi:MAG: IPTL-CTERM sorting domain-containing protein [Saprospirales bacterium]|nr:IPTL-CTERM sorting domain-containing protein [Saprospirales bacterium]
MKTTWSTTQRVIVDWGLMTPNGSRYTVNMLNGGLRIEVGGNGVTTATLINNGSWHHIAATYDNTLATDKHKLYIDGVFIIGSNLTVAANTLPGNIIIGRRNDGINYWQGNIDDVRVWNVAKSAAEIAAGMNTEMTGLEPGLIFYSKFDETTASCDVVDCSPGQHHGTRIGSTGTNNLPQYSADVPAGVADAPCGICLTNCLVTCDISDVSISNLSACNDNGTPADPSDDTFTADVTVDFVLGPGSGTLDISGDGSASVSVAALSGCTHTFSGVTMSADGSVISLTAAFSANPSCTLTNPEAGIAPASCSAAQPPSCSVDAITAANFSDCNDGGTPANGADDTFTADVTVTFSNPPTTGTLNLSGDGSASVPVGSLGAGTYTFVGVTMSANGGAINLTAAFSADAACSLTNGNAGTAPANCSPLAPTIPTMSEWGLILFALILFTLSVVFGTQQIHAMAMGGSGGKISGSTASWKLPFDRTSFFRILPLVYLGIAVVFTLAVILFGYEMTMADVPGSLLSGGIIAYLVLFIKQST